MLDTATIVATFTFLLAGFVKGVVGLGLRAEHAERNRAHVREIGLKALAQPVLSHEYFRTSGCRGSS